MGCVDFIAKYLLFSVNFVITLLGIVTITLGALFLYTTNQSVGSTSFAIVFPILIIVFGCVVFLIASFGCCGTIGESQCLLITYTVFLTITLACNIYLVVVFNGAIGVVVDAVKNEMDTSFANSNSRDIFMGLEGLFQCCGTTGPDAYTELGLDLPLTCCHTLTSNNITIDINDMLPENITDPNDIQLCVKEDAHPTGCTQVVTDFIHSLSNIVFYFFIFTLVVEGVGVLSASYLAWHFSRKSKPDKLGTTVSRPPIHVRDTEYHYQRPQQLPNNNNMNYGQY